MTPERRDELAPLCWAVAQCFATPSEQRREVTAMLQTQSDCSNADAWALITRGKSMAREADLAARQKGERV